VYLKGDADLRRLINFEEFISWAVSEKVALPFCPPTACFAPVMLAGTGCSFHFYTPIVAFALIAIVGG